MHHTKIIATIGKYYRQKGFLLRMAKAGMNISRLNFSHSTPESHIDKIKAIRKMNKTHGTRVKIMVDLKGPEVRMIGLTYPIEIRKGETIIFSNDRGLDQIQISNPDFLRKVEKGSKILADDGNVEFLVVKRLESGLKCKALSHSVLKPNKSISSEFITPDQKAILEADEKAIQIGVENKVEYIAVSHVTSAQDIKDARKVAGKSNISFVAKIENYEAVRNIREIVKVSDGIMIARGDLGINIPLVLVPVIQERIIRLCEKNHKFSVVATQMMESMIENKRPTRAEVSDVYGAIRQGAHAVMLSGETAVGKYPVSAVEYMNDIMETARSVTQRRSVLPRKR